MALLYKTFVNGTFVTQTFVTQTFVTKTFVAKMLQTEHILWDIKYFYI